MNQEHQASIKGSIVHEPARPARADHPEADYLRMWQAIVQSEAAIAYFFPDGITQRRATAAASFMCWLGTACGLALLQGAKRLQERSVFGSRSACYTVTWALHNQRNSSSNGGLRYIETMLARGEPILGPGEPNWKAVQAAAIDLDDIDTIERLLEWFGTSPGQCYLDAAEAASEASRKLRDVLRSIG